MFGKEAVEKVAELGTSIVGVIDQLVEDKDLALTLKHKFLKLQMEFSLQVLATKTNPFVDGLVKLAYAMREVIIPLFRPIGSLAVTGFGIYAHIKGIQIDPVTHGVLDAAFPGWMTSRHMEKSKAQKEETRREELRAAQAPGHFTYLPPTGREKDFNPLEAES